MERYVEPTEQLVVEVFVRDIKRSREFYQRLGFQVVEDRETFVALAWEGHRLFLDERKESSAPNFPQANVRIMVPNVDEYWKLVNDLEASVLSPIADRSYGLRDFTVGDPDGFGLRFGTRLSPSPARTPRSPLA